MKKNTILSILALCALLFSCSSKDNGATERLNNARASLNEQDFARAKGHLDSLEILYPKALNERLSAMALLDTIRRAENDYIIKTCDSLLVFYQVKVDSIKNGFITEEQKDENSSTISFIPRESWTNGMVSQTSLRSRVMSNGEFRIESYFVGPKQSHDRLGFSAKDASSVESLPITGDGFNFRFSNLGKNYEVMTITPATNNGITEFLVENQEKNIQVKLIGKQTYQYTLPKSSQKAIIKSINLSKAILTKDSLATEKEKAAFRNYNLDLKSSKDSIK